MADVIPLKRHTPEDGLAEFRPTDSVGVNHGGTGANDLAGAKQALEIVTSISSINTEAMLTYFEPFRSKQLTTGSNCFTWSEANIGNNDWVQIGVANDALTGHIMHFDGTVVGYSVHCENTQGNTRILDLHINNTIINVIAIPNGTNVSNVDMDIDIDFSQGDKLRIRGEGSGGQILDTVITLIVRWRA